MPYNVPDDWNSYYRFCYDCGTQTHASEGYACNCQPDEVYISSRYTVCSKTGDIKETQVYKNAHGGIETIVTEYTFNHMKSMLTAGQIKYRNDLMKRLHTSAQIEWQVEGYPLESDRLEIHKFRGNEEQFNKWFKGENLENRLDDIQVYKDQNC